MILEAIAAAVAALLIYRYIASKYDYFSSKPVPCVKPTLLLGSSGPLIARRIDIKAHVQRLYDAFPEAIVTGFYDFTSPIFMIRDPELIKKIAIKDFDHFMDHTPTMPVDDDSAKDSAGDSLFANSLFLLRGQKWRDMRATLSPAFTGSKMRHMFDLVAECSKSMTEFFKTEAKAGKRLEYEMKDVFSRFGTDLIATVAFGIKVDSLREQENEFYTKGKRMLNFTSPKVLAKILLMRAAPGLMRKLKADVVDAESAEYFRGVILNNMNQRKAHGIVRNDMIQMLMEVRRGALKYQQDDQDEKDAGFATVEESQVGRATHSRVWTENELTAQCFLFFLAGFDTLSACLSFLMYDLTVNADVQKRLFEEVMDVEEQLNGGALSYEVLQRMQYLDMVVSEVLRKWPPGVAADRHCTKDYHCEGDHGNSFTIEKGRTIWIPSIAIHNDPKYYPDPDRFDPERFSEQNRANIIQGTYLPFGLGPRNCVGSRLALMEVKSIVYHLLRDFSLEPTEKTQIPLKLSKKMFPMQGEKGLWLELKPRSF